ncbi:MAG: hypothetical protein KTR29_06165 [Rhodothermaceae bacterium]|nr:hypothetical protein [Rhodothermaceae bacterium]
MNIWVFIGIAGATLLVLAIAYFVVELVGRAAEKRYKTEAKEALEKYWRQHKDDLLKDLPCPSCSISFDAPDTTYFECPSCSFLMTQEWVKSYHHRKLKDEWENSFSGRYYRIAPEVRE